MDIPSSFCSFINWKRIYLVPSLCPAGIDFLIHGPLPADFSAGMRPLGIHVATAGEVLQKAETDQLRQLTPLVMGLYLYESGMLECWVEVGWCYCQSHFPFLILLSLL